LNGLDENKLQYLNARALVANFGCRDFCPRLQAQMDIGKPEARINASRQFSTSVPEEELHARVRICSASHG
jgi:hypothetical protein